MYFFFGICASFLHLRSRISIIFPDFIPQFKIDRVVDQAAARKAVITAYDKCEELFLSAPDEYDQCMEQELNKYITQILHQKKLMGVGRAEVLM